MKETCLTRKKKEIKNMPLRGNRRNIFQNRCLGQKFADVDESLGRRFTPQNAPSLRNWGSLITDRYEYKGKTCRSAFYGYLSCHRDGAVLVGL